MRMRLLGERHMFEILLTRVSPPPQWIAILDRRKRKSIIYKYLWVDGWLDLNSILTSKFEDKTDNTITIIIIIIHTCLNEIDRDGSNKIWTDEFVKRMEKKSLSFICKFESIFFTSLFQKVNKALFRNFIS